ELSNSSPIYPHGIFLLSAEAPSFFSKRKAALDLYPHPILPLDVFVLRLLGRLKPQSRKTKALSRPSDSRNRSDRSFFARKTACDAASLGRGNPHIAQ